MNKLKCKKCDKTADLVDAGLKDLCSDCFYKQLRKNEKLIEEFNSGFHTYYQYSVEIEDPDFSEKIDLETNQYIEIKDNFNDLIITKFDEQFRDCSCCKKSANEHEVQVYHPDFGGGICFDCFEKNV